MLFFGGCLLLLPAWMFFHQHHLEEGPETASIRTGVFTLVILVFNGCILGMAQKIVPFMMWHHLYSKYLGNKKVPNTIDLLNSWTLWPIAAVYLVAALFFLSAFIFDASAIIRPGAITMLLAYVLFTCNAPKLEDFTPQNVSTKPTS